MARPVSNSPEVRQRALPELIPTVEMPAMLARLTRDGRSGPGRTVNCQAALDRWNSNWELFADLLRFTISGIPRLTEATKAAATAGNAKQLEHAAHELVGLLGNLDAQGAISVAQRMGNLARAAVKSQALDADAMTEARRLCLELDEKTQEVLDVVCQFCAAKQHRAGRGP